MDKNTNFNNVFVTYNLNEEAKQANMEPKEYAL